MRALVLRAPRQFAVEDVPVPAALDPDDVLCKVHTTFICGTDPHIINGDYPGLLAAVVPVHPGPRVVGGSRRGRHAREEPGLEGRRPRLRHLALRLRRLPQLPARPLQPVPELRPARDAATGSTATSRRAPTPTTSRPRSRAWCACRTASISELSACVDPLSIALYTVKRSRLQPGDDLLVMGTGPQGLMAILVGKALGAGRILAVGSGARLALAEKLGALPIDYRQGKVVERVREMTDGLGVPAVLECAGTAQSIRDCCLAAAKGGVVSVIGIPHDEPQLPMKRIVLDEIEIVGDRANPNTAEAALALLVNGRVDLTPLLTHRFPLADFATALETFESRRDGAVKVAIKP